MIYVSFGMEKAGSSLTYNLTKFILEASGHPHIQLSAENRQDEKNATQANNVRKFEPGVVAAAEEASVSSGGKVVTLRTHAEPSSYIEDAIRAGRGLHHVAIRDLRDVALSFMDAAARREALGRPNTSHVRWFDLASTFPALQRNVDCVFAWCGIPSALLLYYEVTAFTPHVTIGAISRQLNLRIPESRYDEIFAKSIEQKNNKFNVAANQRHRWEMTEEDQARVMSAFPAFYERFFPDAEIAVEALELSRFSIAE